MNSGSYLGCDIKNTTVYFFETYIYRHAENMQVYNILFNYILIFYSYFIKYSIFREYILSRLTIIK